jgi:lipoic acid synthetase
MMLGLGETFEEVIKTMQETVKIGVNIFTIGQYLQPSKDHLSVDRYVEEKECGSCSASIRKSNGFPVKP